MWFLIGEHWRLVDVSLAPHDFDFKNLEIVKHNYRAHGLPIAAIARLKSKIDNKQTRA